MAVTTAPLRLLADNTRPMREERSRVGHHTTKARAENNRHLNDVVTTTGHLIRW